MKFALKLLLLLLYMAGDPAVAQSSSTDASRVQEREQEVDQPQEAQVGAGTTAEATTGSSGYERPPQPGFSSQAGTAGQGAGPTDLSQLCDEIADPQVLQHCVEKAEQ